MTEASRRAQAVVVQPRLSVERLADLRALVDALMASCIGDPPPCNGAGNWSARRRQRDLFDEKSPVAELRPDLRNKLALLLQTSWRRRPASSSAEPNRRIATA